MTTHRAGLCLAVLTLVSIVGCGAGVERPDTHPVTGKVTLNGDAVEGAQVVFHTESGRKAIGTTKSDGTYELTTFDSGDGCIAGKAKVTISKTEGGGGGNDDDWDDTGDEDPYGDEMDAEGNDKALANLLPEAYASVDTTPETREVAAGSNEFNFDLKN